MSIVTTEGKKAKKHKLRPLWVGLAVVLAMLLTFAWYSTVRPVVLSFGAHRVVLGGYPVTGQGARMPVGISAERFARPEISGRNVYFRVGQWYYVVSWAEFPY